LVKDPGLVPGILYDDWLKFVVFS